MHVACSSRRQKHQIVCYSNILLGNVRCHHAEAARVIVHLWSCLQGFNALRFPLSKGQRHSIQSRTEVSAMDNEVLSMRYCKTALSSALLTTKVLWKP